MRRSISAMIGNDTPLVEQGTEYTVFICDLTTVARYATD